MMVSFVCIMVKLEDIIDVYYRARRNKRRSRDSFLFERDQESGLVRLWRDINDRNLDVHSNYAFVVFSPKPREIFATSISVRVIHHYLDWRLRDIYESVLSERSFNNRKGMGLHKAIETFHADVREVSCNYMKDAWIAHLDLKGYFPNANVEIALAQQLDLIERYYEGDDKEDLKYMMTVCMRADPARHCAVYVPRSNWSVIAPEKSLFNKPVGTGGAIGFLCWQNAMGYYINDVTRWLDSFEFMRVMVFVDDIYVVTSDRAKFLALMPELRERLNALDVNLNEKKFYLQHCSKCCRVLGTYIHFDREYVDNTLVDRAFRKIRYWKNRKTRTREALRMLSSMNTYNSVFKSKNMKVAECKFRDAVLTTLDNYIEWNPTKDCFALRDRYSFRAALQKRYRVRL